MHTFNHPTTQKGMVWGKDAFLQLRFSEETNSWKIADGIPGSWGNESFPKVESEQLPFCVHHTYEFN